MRGAVFPSWGLAVLCAALCLASAARAEERRTERAPDAAGTRSADEPIVPPVLLGTASVPYPEGAEGDATVELAVTVSADGSVRETRVLSGSEPFASAARAAAATLKFSPATRAGRAISAVIRYEISFAKPAAPPASDAEGPVPASQRSREAAPAPPTGVGHVDTGATVLVQGERPPPSVTTLGRAEVRELPGAFGDPFRAIEAMPGVTPIATGLPFFYVRGAPPGDIGYFLDGVRVPYLYHVGLGPSVVHPGMVDRVDLYSGGYPASFGRFAGGIVSGETTTPRDDFHGEFNLRLFDVGALAESGFADGRGTVLVGGRYSYTAAIISLLAPNVVLDYRDYQLRTTYDFSRRDRLTVFGFGAYDLLGEKHGDALDVLFGSEFYRLDTRYDHAFSDGTTFRAAVALGYDRTSIEGQQIRTDRMIAPRLEVRHPFGNDAVLRAGIDSALDTYGASELYTDPDNPTTQTFATDFAARRDFAIGAYADVKFRPVKRIELTPGLRVDLFTSGTASAVGVDPRISGRFFITDHFRIVHAYGVVHQPPSFIIPLPGFSPANLSGGLQKGFQTSAGIEADLPQETTAAATLFHSAFFDMSDALGAGDTRNLEKSLNQRSLGDSYGVELLVKRRLTQRLGGLVSYTLSRSTRALDNAKFPSAFDRTHVGTAAVAYTLGARWRFGTRLMFYTGVPKVPSHSSAVVLPPPPAHPDRDPAFYRLDLRLEKQWPLGKKGFIAFVVEVLNATLQKESVQGTSIGPVTIPSIGVEGAL